MINGFAQGLRAYFEAYQILSRLRLWKYFAIPIVLSVIIFFIIGVLSYFLSEDIGNYIANVWFSTFWPWDHGRGTIHNISNMLGAMIVILIGFIVFKYLIMALSAPFIGPISKIIEDDFTGIISEKENSSSFKLLLRGVKIAMRNLLRELLLTLPILFFRLDTSHRIIFCILNFSFTVLFCWFWEYGPYT